MVDDVDCVNAAQERVDAYGDAAVADAVADARAELAACRGTNAGESALDPFEQAVLERLAWRIAERTLPDVRAAVSDGMEDATVAATVDALFSEG